MHSRISITASLLAAFCLCHTAVGQTPQAQINTVVDESASVTMVGNVHPLTTTATSSAAADPSAPMQHMVLTLKGTAAQQAALDQLIAGQNNPSSPLYHQYLTPQTYAAMFGAAASDISKVTAWLQSHGFQVEQVADGNRAIVFSGNAGQVSSAFKTEMRQYMVAGASHLANASDPSIPAALSGVVGGVVKLHDFRHSSNISSTNISTASTLSAANLTKTPQYTSGGSHYLTPSDYYTIYNINPLLTAGVNGTGQSIAVIARSDIYLSDVESFRSTFGLKANDPQFIVTNSDPGVLQGDSVETTLDTEWAGAVAPNATVKVIISSSGSSDGIDLSSLYAVSKNVAPIITVSYGSCEAGMGSSEVAYYSSLWQQAASQGQSVMVSSGDSGAAGCQGGSNSSGSGQAINGLCSSAYSTCVGGTEFSDTSNPGQYWLSANSATYGSAISYIPEGVWNESGNVSGGSGLWAGGGGASIFFSKPAWQTGPGVPADNKRDVPDVSLTASSHDGYFIAYGGGWGSVGGTSASAPSFAGMVALIDQKMNARQGLVNTILYPLAAKQAAGGPAVFHDITSGNNSVPGVTGFSATTGYDLGSGLGTVDANVMVNNWASGNSTAATLSLSSSVSSLTALVGGAAQTATITSTASSALKAAVSLTVTAPSGITAKLASASIASPGSGTDVLSVTAAATVTPGTYSVVVTGTGGGQTATVTISVVVPTPSFTISSTAATLSLGAGSNGTTNISITAQNGFSSAVALTVSGLPAGVTAAFTPASITTTAASVLKFTVASSAAPATSTITITGTSGSLTAKTTVSLIIPATFNLATNAASLFIVSGSSGSINVSVSAQNGSNPAVALSVTGLPTGVTATFTPSSITGTGVSALKFTAASNAASSTSTVTITGTSGSLAVNASISLTVSAPTLTMTASAPTVSIPANSSGTVTLTTTQIALSGSVALTVSGLPTGVTASFTPATLSTSGTSTLKLTTGAVTAGTYALTVTATGGGKTATSSISLVVPAATFTLGAGATSVSVMQGNTGQLALSMAAQNNFASAVTLSVTGLPTGVTGAFSPATMSSASATSKLTLTVASSATAGTYPLTISATGGGVTKTASASLVVTALPTCVAAASPASVSVKAGLSATMLLACGSPTGTFSGPLAVTVTGAPSGMTAQPSASTLTPGSTLTLNIATAETLAGGTYNLTYTVTGSGYTKSVTIPVVVTGQNTLMLSASQMSVILAPGASQQVTLTTTALGSFNSAANFSYTTTGGITVALSKTSLPAPGSGTVVATISAPSNAALGNYVAQLTVVGGNVNESAYIAVQVANGPSFTFTTTTTAMSVAQGSSGTVVTTSGNYTGGFSGQMSLSVSGLPSGVSAQMLNVTPSNNYLNDTWKISAGSSTPAGTYPVTITAAGVGGINRTVTFQLTVTK